MRRQGRREGEPTWGDGSCRVVAVSGRKVAEHPAERAWQSGGTLGPWSSRTRGFGAVRSRPRGRRVSNAGAARAEPADTCGRRAGARRTGSPGARGTVAARACLPAHVGVIFKWNVVLAARLSGGRVGPPALAGGRCRPAPRPLRAQLTGQPGCPHCGLPAHWLAGAGEPDSEFRALPKPPRRCRVPAAESCLLLARLRLPHSHSGNKATNFTSPWRPHEAGLRGHRFQSQFHTLTYSLAHCTLAAR